MKLWHLETLSLNSFTEAPPQNVTTSAIYDLPFNRLQSLAAESYLRLNHYIITSWGNIFWLQLAQWSTSKTTRHETPYKQATSIGYSLKSCQCTSLSSAGIQRDRKLFWGHHLNTFPSIKNRNWLAPNQWAAVDCALCALMFMRPGFNSRRVVGGSCILMYFFSYFPSWVLSSRFNPIFVVKAECHQDSIWPWYQVEICTEWVKKLSQSVKKLSLSPDLVNFQKCEKDHHVKKQ